MNIGSQGRVLRNLTNYFQKLWGQIASNHDLECIKLTNYSNIVKNNYKIL